MKKKMIISSIKHGILLVIVIVFLIFSFIKIYDLIIDNSVVEKGNNYLTLVNDNYTVECMDYYFNTKFHENNKTHEVYYPSTFLILRLRITNTSNEDITLTNDYKLSFNNEIRDLKHGINKNKLNIEPGKSVISNIAYIVDKSDENTKEYYIDFNGNKMKLIFE